MLFVAPARSSKTPAVLGTTASSYRHGIEIFRRTASEPVSMQAPVAPPEVRTYANVSTSCQSRSSVWLFGENPEPASVGNKKSPDSLRFLVQSMDASLLIRGLPVHSTSRIPPPGAAADT